MVEVAGIDRRVGIIGPKIFYYDFNGRKDIINMVGGSICISKGTSTHLELDRIEITDYGPSDFGEVDWVEGSCMMVRRQVFEQIGLLNSNYFAYWEETDFCRRARRKGWRVARADNDVLAGIRRTAQLLRDGRIVICGGCGDAIREFGAYCWDQRAVGDRVKKEHDHAMDEIRYFASQVHEAGRLFCAVCGAGAVLGHCPSFFERGSLDGAI